jgi:flagellar hook-associated protein 3 FlgL
MTRVSTMGNYNSALLNLFSAQNRQFDAQQRLATEKIATDLQGFGRSSESLTALKGAQARIQGFIDTGDAMLARLDTQDLALSRGADALDRLRSAIVNSIANDAGGTLNLELESAFQAFRGSLNMEHQGQFAFSGGNATELPVGFTTLDQLVAAPDVASAFNNGTLKTRSRISETTAFDSSFLANEIGTEALQIMRDIRAFSDTNVDGPFAARLTEPQKTFLTGKLAELATASRNFMTHVAQNGALFQQVKNINENNAAQLFQLDELVGKRTDADLAQAAVDIKLSEVAIQASAQVINQLRNVSLLNFLN